MISIPTGYLLFLGDARDRLTAKTAGGILQWRPEICIGQLRLDRETVDLGIPDMTPAQARAAGAGSLVIGVAPVGGSTMCAIPAAPTRSRPGASAPGNEC